jgi:hypothetical protein
MNTAIDNRYLEHKVFTQLIDYANFYNALSFHILGWVKHGTQAIMNLDTYVYSSMQGTLESIRDILIKGRINDSYSLLRKYYDATIINVYSNLYLSDNFSIDNFTVVQIDNWLRGINKLPEYRKMSKYIRDSTKLAPIITLLFADEKYKNIRERCNDHTHYNYYHNLLLNDNEIYLANNKRLNSLNRFSADLEDIFIQHLAFLFYLNEHYMMSSDYTDSLELGMEPEEGSQYFVAPFIQDIFNKVIKAKRADIAEEIKRNSSMELE